MNVGGVVRGIRRALWLAGVLLGLGATPGAAGAQEPAEGPEGERPNVPVELVDRVAAVVGDTVVLYSEILESLVQAQAQGETLPPPDTPAFDSVVHETLDALIDQLVLLQRARQEDITVTEDVVEAETDRRFREVRGSFPNGRAFEQAIEQSGRTMPQYRLYLRSQVRAQMMINQYVQQMRGSMPAVTVDDDEIREWFEANVADETQPPRVTLEQVVIRPEPSPEAEAAARERAIEALEAVRGGMEFDVAARQYSEDPANRNTGGDLGWVRRSEIDPDFARAAWAARTGTPIGPVRTQFGYHVVKVENARGGERRIRHIVVQPEIGTDDVERARELAAVVADSAREGVSMEQLARNHGISEEPVRLPNASLDRLQEGGYGEYARRLSSPMPGEVIGPFETQVPNLRFVVLKVVEFSPGGRLQLDEVRDEIAQGLRGQKALARLVERLRDEVFVEVRL